MNTRIDASPATGLRTLDRIPDGFLDADPADLLSLLGGPTLIHLPGRRVPALFVSILLHGNEHTSLRALQILLRKAAARALPRALSIFVGNVGAAAAGLRRLDGQPDWNRIWPGSEEPPGPERALADAVTAEMRARGVFASIDVHNNTGLNPHYGCVTRLDAASLHLSALFSRIAVYFTRPTGVQTGAFADFAPSVAIECGKSGDPANDARAAEYLEACLHLSELPSHPVAAHDLDLFHTVCTVKVREDVGFAFAPEDAALQFDADLDHMNFRELAAGTPIARTDRQTPLPLLATDNDGGDVTGGYFSVDAGRLLLRRAVMPAMLTLDRRVIRQDCLCYLMERLPLPR